MYICLYVCVCKKLHIHILLFDTVYYFYSVKTIVNKVFKQSLLTSSKPKNFKHVLEKQWH